MTRRFPFPTVTSGRYFTSKTSHSSIQTPESQVYPMFPIYIDTDVRMDEDDSMAMEGVVSTQSWSPTSIVFNIGRQFTDWLMPKPTSPTAPSFVRAPIPVMVEPAAPIRPSKPPRAWINDLPAELLAEIFMLFTHVCVADRPRSMRYRRRNRGILARPGASTDPVLVGRVCAYWRAVALSTPGLWSTICITNPNSQDCQEFDAWMHRSRNAPLHLTFGYVSISPSFTLESSMTSCYLTAKAQAHRWKHVYFDMMLDSRTDSTLIEALDPITSSSPPLPLLESYELRICDSQRELTLSLSKWLHSSPSLQRIETRSLNDNITQMTSLSQTFLHQLQAVTLDQVNHLHLLQLLANSSNLKLLDVKWLMPTAEDNPYAPETIFLPALESLSLGNSPHIMDAIDALVVPSLKNLKLPCGLSRGYSFDKSWGQWQDLFTRSNCKLTDLTLYCIDTAGENFAAQLLASPQLSALETLRTDAVFGDQIALSLTYSPLSGKEPLLPILSRLELDFCGCADDHFVAMVRSRQPTLRYVQAAVGRHRGLAKLLHSCLPGVVFNIIEQ